MTLACPLMACDRGPGSVHLSTRTCPWPLGAPSMLGTAQSLGTLQGTRGSGTHASRATRFLTKIVWTLRARCHGYGVPGFFILLLY